MTAIFLKLATWIFSSNLDKLLEGVLGIWAKSKDVDLTKFTTSTTAVAEVTKTVVEANTKFAETQASYAMTLLNWRGFRILLWVLMAVAVCHYALVVADTALPKVFGYKSWDIDPVQGSYAEVTKQLLLFFVLLKPVDTAISGIMMLLGRYLQK
jgi:hypothetical protein